MVSAQPWSTGGPAFYLSALIENDVAMAAAFALSAWGFVRALRHERTYAAFALYCTIFGQLLLYSAIATKKPFYLLTAYPIAAIGAARVLAPIVERVAYRRMLAAAALAIVFLSRTMPLVMPDPKEEESAWLAPLATRMRALSRPGDTLHTLDVYLASPQFYSARSVVYAVSDPNVVELIGRIPYLRYGKKVVPYDDRLLRGGGWMIAAHENAEAVLARVPRTTVVAYNPYFVLLRGPE
jgi:predicted membrane-bound mannosyltransferase